MTPLRVFLYSLLIYTKFSPGLPLTINRRQILNPDFEVTWTADLTSEIVTFEIIAKTNGYVGFGISKDGGMKNADMVIGGVQDGFPYFADYHAAGIGMPDIDAGQDWTLLSASENMTHTTLSFTRALNTCDNDDVLINNDTTKFIWSLGASDVIAEHIKRGSSAVNILDPPSLPHNITEYQVWHINVRTMIPNTDTTYWCTAHKAPHFTSKQHIVGFKVKLENEESRKHNHHMILHHCVGTTPELLQFYESLVGTTGGHCYFDGSMMEMMYTCEQYVYVWGTGGEPLFLPSNVGIPLSEFDQPEYYLLEIHYDNPKKLPGIQYETGLEIYTTSNLREHDAGILSVGHAVRFTLTIPPETSDFTVVGHCSSACTQKNFPVDGINIFNILLHSHIAGVIVSTSQQSTVIIGISGRKLKLRHFRDGVELPWVAEDNNYDFNYQQNRMLPEHRKIFGGDHLTYECTDDSSGREPPEAVIGGLTTRHEMCLAIIMYYPLLPTLDMCGSSAGQEETLRILGIHRVDLRDPLDPLVLAPPEYANKHYSEVVSHLIPWNDTLKERFQKVARFGTHKQVCESYRFREQQVSKVDYPTFTAYTPNDVCAEDIIKNGSILVS